MHIAIGTDHAGFQLWLAARFKDIERYRRRPAKLEALEARFQGQNAHRG